MSTTTPETGQPTPEERLLPAHEGPCGPWESCDGLCAEAAAEAQHRREEELERLDLEAYLNRCEARIGSQQALIAELAEALRGMCQSMDDVLRQSGPYPEARAHVERLRLARAALSKVPREEEKR